MSEDLRNPYPPDTIRKGAAWICRQCKYNLNYGDTCVNCGRDHFGTEVADPVDPSTQPFRPGLKGS